MTRDINQVDRFSAVTSRYYQQALATAVEALTQQGLQDGFDAEDIKAILGFMVECEIDTTADCYEK